MNILSPELQPIFRRRAMIALSVFFVAQLMGLLVRILPLQPLPVNASYLINGHTHVALAGWAMGGLYLALLTMVPAEKRRRKGYGVLWWLCQLGVLGMLLTFPVMGYKPLSLVFSTLVLLVSYVYAWRLWRDGRRQGDDLAWVSVGWSLFFLVLGSLAPWTLGYLMTRMPGTIWTELAVGFYLHFLASGFFTFAVLGLLLRWFETRGYALESAGLRLNLLAWGCLPAFALSALTYPLPGWVRWVAMLGAGVQLLALLGLMPMLIRGWRGLLLASVWSRGLIGLSMGSLVIKLGLQGLQGLQGLMVWPGILLVASRPLQIATLHLVFLGLLTCFMLAWLIEHGLLRPSSVGLGLFTAGFVLSEGLLLGQGFKILPAGLPVSQMLFWVSALMPVGTGILLLRQIPWQHRSAQPEVISSVS